MLNKVHNNRFFFRNFFEVLCYNFSNMFNLFDFRLLFVALFYLRSNVLVSNLYFNFLSKGFNLRTFNYVKNQFLNYSLSLLLTQALILSFKVQIFSEKSCARNCRFIIFGLYSELFHKLTQKHFTTCSFGYLNNSILLTFFHSSKTFVGLKQSAFFSFFVSNFNNSNAVENTLYVYNNYLNYYLAFFLMKTQVKSINRVVVDTFDIKFFITQDDFIPFIKFLKKNILTQYQSLIDIVVVDFPGSLLRFKLIYYFLSLLYVSRVCCIFSVKENSTIDSISSIYKGANWIEREVWDMFGIYYINHPDLRRILTDYGFNGFPLRKDFPLVGFVEVFFDDTKNRIVQLPVSLAQELRVFSFKNPWGKSRLSY